MPGILHVQQKTAHPTETTGSQERFRTGEGDAGKASCVHESTERGANVLVVIDDRDLIIHSRVDAAARGRQSATGSTADHAVASEFSENSPASSAREAAMVISEAAWRVRD
jgi:hypothetical protein